MMRIWFEVYVVRMCLDVAKKYADIHTILVKY